MTMSTVEGGHAVIADAMLAKNYWLAWGDLGSNYPDTWTTTDTPPENLSEIVTLTLTKGAPNTSDQITTTDVIKIVKITGTAGAVYAQGADYYLDSGKVNWSIGGNEPAQGSQYTLIVRRYQDAITGLVHELGRRIVGVKSFAIQDPAGTIKTTLPDGTTQNWSTTNNRTPYIYLNFDFDPADAAGSTIYQTALYEGSAASGAPGQYYFPASSVNTQGNLYMVENHKPFPREVGKRETFDLIIRY